MTWQDLVFTIGSLILTISIVPMVRHKHKPPLHASLPVAAILAVFAATYVTLGFVAAPVIEAIQAALWGVLVVQKLTADKAEQ